jgi:uncharacterized membrane protein YccC
MSSDPESNTATVTDDANNALRITLEDVASALDQAADQLSQQPTDDDRAALIDDLRNLANQLRAMHARLGRLQSLRSDSPPSA